MRTLHSRYVDMDTQLKLNNVFNLKNAKKNSKFKHFKILIFFLNFSEIISLDISCESSALQMIHMKC